MGKSIMLLIPITNYRLPITNARVLHLYSTYASSTKQYSHFSPGSADATTG